MIINLTPTYGSSEEGENQSFEVSCDICEEVQYYDDIENWAFLMELMRENGWKSVKKSDGSWQNRCRKCAELNYRDLKGKL